MSSQETYSIIYLFRSLYIHLRLKSRVNELVGRSQANLGESIKTKPPFVGSPRIAPRFSLKRDRP